jgi:type IV pilus assembly protein PilO
MNLSDINWDPSASGTWPLPVKAGVTAIVCVIVALLGIYVDTAEQLKALEVAEKKEVELRQEFEKKQNKAVNLQDYQDQLTQMEAELYEMIRQMPTKEEIASLLTDISQTALANGLKISLFKPSAAIRKDFYSEIPISIEVTGKYDELGLFVSGLAALPRIVTVHDVIIVPIDSKKDKGKDKNSKEKNNQAEVRPGEMVMTAIVKTYNESSGAPPEETGNKKKKIKKGKN